MEWRHIKTGKMHIKTGVAINATNAQDGELMVCYHSKEKDPTGRHFVRNRREFMDKFEPID